ncbi:ABC transporter permease [Aggregatilinea lenta]|uniref:ABC transporter permease n=1 Tax=Aggregatilinea lenta TaxID=913108 RepID=UPI000E5BE6EB|nr:ABC transporter permease [Aggregatilinea lenta]
MNFRYIVQRLVFAVFVIVGVTFLAFAIVRGVGGDPARVKLGVTATEENVAAQRERMGLNRPFLVQYGDWLLGVVQGDFGQSLITDQRIGPQLEQRLPATLQLGAAAILIGMLIAFPLGILAALRSGSKVDMAVSLFSQLGMSIPDFWMGILLVLLFSLQFGVLPPSGYTPIDDSFREWLRHLILPALTAGLISGAIQTRFIRSAMLEVLRANYIQTARAKGLRERTVVVRHAVRAALVNIVTILGLQMTALLSSVVVVEITFAFPGIGWLALNAVLDRDYPLLLATVFVIGVIVTLVNLVIDLLYFFLDPRIEFA